MMSAEELFAKSLNWLKKEYQKQGPFFEERDIVWTVQKYMLNLIKKVPTLRVISEYGIYLSSQKEALYQDLAILENGKVKIIIQFKYEPDHNREEEFNPTKFNDNGTVVSWTNKKDGKEAYSVKADINNTRKIIKDSKAEIGYSIFIDEGKLFYKKKNGDMPEGASWETSCWGNMAVLIAMFCKDS